MLPSVLQSGHAGALGENLRSCYCARALRRIFALLQCAEFGFGEKSRSCNEFIAASKYSGSDYCSIEVF